MNFLTMLQNYILYPIKELMKLFKSEEISNFLFNGNVTYLEVIATFFVGALLIKFLVAPVRLSQNVDSNTLSKLSSNKSGDNNG